MLQNYFKIAWRSILKNRVYSVINILGLSAGIAFTLLIAAYVWSELQVNKGLRNADRQYIIQSKWKDQNLGIEITSLGALPKALKENYPHLVANYYRWDGVTSTVSKDDKTFREGLQICDSTMFDMYGFRLLHGDVTTVFKEPFSLVITPEKAIKYFGKEDVVGETLTIENFAGSKRDFMITGIMEKPSKNSATVLTDNNDNQFYIPAHNVGYFGRTIDAWPAQYIVGYLELQPGVTAKDMEGPMQQLVKEHAPPQFAANLSPYLVSLNEFYLSGNKGLVRKMIYALSAIALFILLMAIVNFINMAVSRSASRMREIGVRKVLGGLKRQLIVQFLTESVILVFFATLFALVIYSVSRELFSKIIGKEIPPLGSFPIYFAVFPLLLMIVVGILAGFYPAFILSSMKSVESLKGKLSSVKDRVLFRKSLVGFQFAMATIVLVGSIIISSQIQLFFSKSLGYDKDYIVSAQVPRDWTREGVRKMTQLREQFAGMNEVSNVTLAYQVPDGNSSGGISLFKDGSDSTTAITSQYLIADEYYAATYNIPMVAGMFFCEPGKFTDSAKIVINEAYAKALGWTADQAIGQKMRFGSTGDPFVVAGVIKDFHFATMQESIQPMTFLHVGVGTAFRFFAFKMKPGNIGNTIGALQKRWSTLMPGAAFEYKFMDDTLKFVYKSEIQLKQASYVATILSLIIVLLGVIGLISLSIQKRTKEIGIRKVLGSSVKDVIALFMKDFLWVVIIAGAAACPVAYLLMNRWLSDYVYRIDITALPFVIAIAILGAVTGLLIIVQTIRAAMANPVKSLRTE